MTNKMYQKGYRFERRVAAYLRGKGYYAIESRGSKGMFDVVGIPPSNDKGMHNYPLLIQCKATGKIPKAELESIKFHSPKWQGWAMLAYSKNRKLMFEGLNKERLII